MMQEYFQMPNHWGSKNIFYAAASLVVHRFLWSYAKRGPNGNTEQPQITLFEYRCVDFAASKHWLISTVQNGRRIKIKAIKENDATKRKRVFSLMKM